MDHDKKSKIIIDKEKKKHLINEIKKFFVENREEEIGDLPAEMLADLLIEKVGAEIYNKALFDAQIWFKSKLEILEDDYYSLERKPR